MKNKNHETQKFIILESLSAKLLLGATLLALILSNSSLHNYYFSFFHHYIYSTWGDLKFKSNLLFWINDGLMTIFFLVVGLEIKYELLRGNLNSLRKAALPAIGAIGGMVIPALLYISINCHDSLMLRGWAVPTATDIAFALCILSLLGAKFPSSLKAFLTTLAILDDLIAILIIAIFYTDHLAFNFLALAFFCVLVLFILNIKGITTLAAYLIIGIILWVCFLKSGIHPTLAGVIVALMIPLKPSKKTSPSPLQKLQHRLHPWVALVIIPLFAFANAGIYLLNLGQENLQISIILGVLFGLFLGKQIGIFGAAWLAVKFGIALLPERVRWSELYAVSIICGIGFTISLFIGTLAFNSFSDNYLNSVKVGVLSGSLLSGTVGYLVLLTIYRIRNKKSK